MEIKRLAIIRIHGKKGLKKGIKDTFNMIRLYKKNTCVIIINSPYYIGMIKKINEYVTWGEIDEATFSLLLSKRGKLARKKAITEEYVKEKLNMPMYEFVKKFITANIELKDLPGLKLFFKLSPPKGGFENGGIKKQFANGGALGYRKEKINDLLKRMI